MPRFLVHVLHELCATNCCVIQPPGSISGKAIMCPRQCLVGMSSSGNVVSYVHEPLGAMSGEAMVPTTHVIIRDCCVLRASATRGKPGLLCAMHFIIGNCDVLHCSRWALTKSGIVVCIRSRMESCLLSKDMFSAVVPLV